MFYRQYMKILANLMLKKVNIFSVKNLDRIKC